jgi:hypothetical protein
MVSVPKFAFGIVLDVVAVLLLLAGASIASDGNMVPGFLVIVISIALIALATWFILTGGKKKPVDADADAPAVSTDADAEAPAVSENQPDA